MGDCRGEQQNFHLRRDGSSGTVWVSGELPLGGERHSASGIVRLIAWLLDGLALRLLNFYGEVYMIGAFVGWGSRPAARRCAPLAGLGGDPAHAAGGDAGLRAAGRGRQWFAYRPLGARIAR